MIKLECKQKNTDTTAEELEFDISIHINGNENIIVNELYTALKQILKDQAQLAIAVTKALKDSECFIELTKEALKVED